MKPNKTILILCVLLLVFFAVNRMFNDDRKVVNLLEEEYEKNEVQIIDGDNFIKYVSDISSVKEVTWLDENVVQFKGKNNDGFNIFQLDYSSKKLSVNTSSIKENFYSKDFGQDIEVAEKIDEDNYVIYVESTEKTGLFHVRRDMEPLMLCENIRFKNKLLFKISDNREKIAYYDEKESIIKVYNLLNGKIAEIKEEINNEISNDFKNNITFSYEAGYIAVANINRENFKESNFSVYGADSGRAYAEKFLGINPIWGKNSLTIAFTYLEDNSIVNEAHINTRELVGDRIGLYNLKTRRITYTQDMGKDYKVIRPSLWKNNREILIIVGKYSKEDNKYNFNKLYSYSLKNNVLTDLKEYVRDIDNIDDNFDITLMDSSLYICSRSKQQKNSIKAINLDNRSHREFKDIEEFITNGEDHSNPKTYKSLGSNSFLYINDRGVYITDLKSNYLKYRSKGRVTNVYPSPDGSRVFIISEMEEKLEFAIINL